MSAFTEAILKEYFVCPDCRGDLALVGPGPACEGCGRRFALHRENLLEILPSRLFARTPSQDPLIRENTKVYHDLFHEAWHEGPKPLPWGHAAGMDAVVQTFYRRQTRLLAEIMPKSARSFLDISAGGATSSLPFKSRFERPFYADLSVPAADWLSSEGVLAVRADYLNPPYRPGSMDVILCTNTLIYGRDHEERLLQTILAAVRPGGTCLLAFHNPHHRIPFKRPGLISYSLRKIFELLDPHRGILERIEPFSFFKEFEANLQTPGAWNAWVRRIYPPTLHVVRCTKKLAAG